jgi:hypothetical protein
MVSKFRSPVQTRNQRIVASLAHQTSVIPISSRQRWQSHTLNRQRHLLAKETNPGGFVRRRDSSKSKKKRRGIASSWRWRQRSVPMHRSLLNTRTSPRRASESP